MTDKIVTVGGRATYDVVDEDAMTSDSAVMIPTQQSVKAYVDGLTVYAQPVFFTAKVTDISSAGSTFVVCPVAGDITEIYTTINNAITVGDAAISFELATVAVTGGGITIAHSGSAAGTVDTATPSAANTVTAGQAIEIITDGGSTDTCECTVTFEITV